VAGMIGDIEQFLDQRRDARQRPKLGLVATSGGPVQQRLLQLRQLLLAKAGWRSQSFLCARGFNAALSPLMPPDPNRLVTDVQGFGDGLHTVPLCESRASSFLGHAPLLLSTSRILCRRSLVHEQSYSPYLYKSLLLRKGQ